VRRKDSGTTLIEMPPWNLKCRCADSSTRWRKIKGAGTSIIQIEGVKSLQGTEYSVIPDRIEAGTYIMAGAITRGHLKVKGAILNDLLALHTKLVEVGVRITQEPDGLLVSVPNHLRAADVKTLPYPGSLPICRRVYGVDVRSRHQRIARISGRTVHALR
jgi:hypothetical protein